MKKKLLIVLSIVIGAFIKIAIIILLASVVMSCGNEDPVVPKGYIEHEFVYSEGLRDTTTYSKYYYNPDGEKLFKNRYYKKAGKDDLYTLGRFYGNFKNWMEIEESLNKLDFKKSQITEGDYFRIETGERLVDIKDENDVDYSLHYNYSFYFYDKETSILYHLHNDT